MGWYIRKAFSAGPIRFNLSKSGCGLSLGVKGARIGVGPRGTYTHFGRGGLYYRSSYGGSSRIDVHPKVNTTQANSSLGDSGALFDNKQINYRQLALDISFKRSRKKEWIYLISGILSFVIGGSLIGSSFNKLAPVLIVLGLFCFFSIVLHNVKSWFLKLKSNRLYETLKKECCQYDNNDFKVNTGRIKEIIERYKLALDEGYLKRALYLFYKDYLNNIVSDIRISEQEKGELKLLEESLNLDKDLVTKIKRWIFNKVYFEVIKDKIFTREEEEEVFKIKNIFSLSDTDVSEEL
jgi:hypothetical protein